MLANCIPLILMLIKYLNKVLLSYDRICSSKLNIIFLLLLRGDNAIKHLNALQRERQLMKASRHWFSSSILVNSATSYLFSCINLHKKFSKISHSETKVSSLRYSEGMAEFWVAREWTCLTSSKFLFLHCYKSFISQ